MLIKESDYIKFAENSWIKYVLRLTNNKRVALEFYKGYGSDTPLMCSRIGKIHYFCTTEKALDKIEKMYTARGLRFNRKEVSNVR